MESTVGWLIGMVVVGVAAWVISAHRTRTRLEDGGEGPGRPASGGASRAGGEERVARAALDRMHDYLRVHVLDPLRSVVDRTSKEDRPKVEGAMAAVDELRVLLEEDSGDRRRLPVNDALREVAEQFAAESPLEVTVDLPDEPVHARLARDAFEDAIFLILLNAEDFAGRGTVRVSLEEEGRWARIRIRDRGPGFSEEALDRALDPFYSTREGALGLGLAHAHRAIDRHGGEVRIRNAAGGAEVEIRIPVDR